MLEPNNIGIRCEIGVDLRREVTLPDIRLTYGLFAKYELTLIFRVFLFF